MILSLILVLITPLPATAVSHMAPTPSDKVATLQTRLNALKSKGFSGVVLIDRNSHTVFDQAIGSVHGRPVQPADLFWIASISKSFTAAAVMKCREQGLIRLHDRITRYLPDVPADKQSITVLQLLTHTSGLPQSYVSETIADRDQAVKALLNEKLASAPGTKFGYSNANYELLAAIVERVNGRTFEDYVRVNLLRPLRLMRTGFWFDGQAKQVTPTRDPLPVRLKHRGWELGAGGMYSCPEDLLRWLDALRAQKILNHESTKLIFSDQVKISEGHAGFAWFHGSTSKGTEFWFTRGNDSFGPNALIYWYPIVHTTIIVTSHSGDDDSSEMGWSRVALREVVDILGF